MINEPQGMPTFGSPPPEGARRERTAVYAVVRGAGGRVALVHDPAGLFLPGGGVETGEGLEEALLREIREECGCEGRILRLVGEAVQYHGEYRSRHVFFAAEFTGPPDRPGEHEMEWFDPGEAVKGLYHRSHAWAVGKVIASA
jgi:8-oxo-dGTP diphosphatase